MSKFTIKALKEYKKEGTKLDKKVINILLNNGYTKDDLIQHMKDILQHGCVSGCVSELIYYNDTIAFFKKYKGDIMEMLKESMDSIGCESPSKLFGDKWDDDDYFIKDTQNQNLLAWYAMEETTYKILNHFEIEY